MNNPVCCYHKSDLDGVCSAAIVRRFVPECELVGVDYGEPFSWERVGGAGKPRRRAYMVDFSLPMADMWRLAGMVDLVWIDHHSSAIRDYAAHSGLDLGDAAILDASMAACELCWHHFAGDLLPWVRDDVRLPPAVRLLGAYDSWRSDSADWEKCILPFQYGMRVKHGIMDPAAQVWTAILRGEAPHGWPPVSVCSVWPTIEQGRVILEYQRQQDERAAREGAFERVLRVEGNALRCICLNTTRFTSQAFASVYDPSRHDVMVAFALMPSGLFKVSIYTDKPSVDCGAIAKAYGGGGHRGAAGFLCERLPEFMVSGESAT